jgi:hypothetical protein
MPWKGGLFPVVVGSFSVALRPRFGFRCTVALSKVSSNFRGVSTARDGARRRGRARLPEWQWGKVVER